MSEEMQNEQNSFPGEFTNEVTFQPGEKTDTRVNYRLVSAVLAAVILLGAVVFAVTRIGAASPNPEKSLTLTALPADVTAAEGETAEITVGAEGEELSYYWFFKHAGDAEFSLNDAFAGSTCVVTMSADRADCQLCCLITDRYGNSVVTGPVTLTLANPAAITRQPADVTVTEGETAEVSVTATGDGLTYQWYFRNAGDSEFYLTDAFAGDTYAITMDADRSGRQVYCVVTDQYGGCVTSDTASLSMMNTAAITRQPVDVAVTEGEAAKIRVEATGDGLTYQWYYANAGDAGFTLTTSFTGDTYTAVMSADRDGRQVYCVITDLYGNTVTSDTVTMTMIKPVTIKKQPGNVTVAEGETAEVRVTAVGDGLTYQWYYKNVGDAGFTLTTSFTGDTYSIAMDASRSGRLVYCVITDQYGNSVTSDTVTLKLPTPLAITKQPKDTTAADGALALVRVEAAGDGLTYQWYFRNAGDTEFTKTSSFTENTYFVEMSASRAGRQVYCVITDRYGNSVTTNTVTLNRK